MSPQAGADSTRERIEAAATAEFARYGIAGARVDRIAKMAKTSKERVYAYFGGKEDLYHHVTGRELTAVAKATRMDPTDLPGYAGRLHDYFLAHPERFRLMAWGRLELDDTTRPADNPIQRMVAHKIEQLRKAQAAGQLDPTWDPIDILTLLNQIATSWTDQPDLVAGLSDDERTEYLAARRAAIVNAVQRLFPRAQPSAGIPDGAGGRGVGPVSGGNRGCSTRPSSPHS